MTSIEWLIEEMFKQGYFDGNKPLTFTNLDHLQQQAKEMHKQEIIDAHIEGQPLYSCQSEKAEQYYQETFVSKGSDDHIVDTNEMIYPKTAFEILQPKLTIADTLEFREKHLPEILDAMEEYATSSQTEISDEEIEKEARDYDNSVIYGPPLLHFEQGAFWYREQLKQRQCNK